MEHLLKMLDINASEITDIINLADQLKYEKNHGIAHNVLAGRTLGMIFRRPSTRTRVSFEVGMYQLGGHAIVLSEDEIAVAREGDEQTEDMARALSRYVDALLIRTTNHAEADNLARYGTVPVINGMTDYAHPCQILSYLMTIREYKGRLDGLKIGFIGEGGAIMNSLIIGCLKCRMHVAVACPEGYDPDQSVIDFAAQVGHFEMYRDPRGAARAADVVVTDAWLPAGREDEENERRAAFRMFQINDDLMRYAKPDALVFHSMPINRGEEITAAIAEHHSGEIFDAAENLLHVQKALLIKILGEEPVPQNII